MSGIEEMFDGPVGDVVQDRDSQVANGGLSGIGPDDPYAITRSQLGLTARDRYWLAAARTARLHSNDPSTKVGAIVYGRDNNWLGSGWNHFPPATPETFWQDRGLKYAHVVHAEVAAVIQAGHAARGATLVSTAHPCALCALVAVEAGIRRAVYPSRPWRDDPAVIQTCQWAAGIFERACVEIVHV